MFKLSIYTAIVQSSTAITFAISYLYHIHSCPNKVVSPAHHVPHAAPCPSSLTPAASPQGQCRDCTQSSCFLRRCWLQQHTLQAHTSQLIKKLASNGASPLLLIHSSLLSSPSHPPPPHPLPYFPLLSLFPPPTSDGVVGGCEVGQCVEVPQEDAVLQTTADGHLSLGGVSQSFDVVLVCPQCGRALPRLGVPQLQSGVRGGREDWSHKREMVAAAVASSPSTHALTVPSPLAEDNVVDPVCMVLHGTHILRALGGRGGEGRGGGETEGKKRGGVERVTSNSVCLCVCMCVCVCVCAPLCCR